MFAVIRLSAWPRIFDTVTMSIPASKHLVAKVCRRAGKFNGNFFERDITCRIYFFSQNDKIYFDDCHLMQELLEMGFYDGLYISGSYWVGIDEIESNIIDTVLEVSFTLYYLEETDPADKDLETMWVLYQKE